VNKGKERFSEECRKEEKESYFAFEEELDEGSAASRPKKSLCFYH
jgi:hypothetical protein